MITTLLLIYGGSVLLSYPFMLSKLKEYDDNIINPKVVATILALLPAINLWISLPLIKSWASLKLLSRRIRRMGKRSKSPEVVDAMIEVSNMLDDHTKLDIE